MFLIRPVNITKTLASGMYLGSLVSSFRGNGYVRSGLGFCFERSAPSLGFDEK